MWIKTTSGDAYNLDRADALTVKSTGTEQDGDTLFRVVLEFLFNPGDADDAMCVEVFTGPRGQCDKFVNDTTKRANSRVVEVAQ